MVWAFEEDYIVCKFYVEYEDDWKDNLDYLMELLWEHGFKNRDKASTRMRVQNYEYLHKGNIGLSNAAKQSKEIYSAIRKRLDNASEYRQLKGYLDAVELDVLIREPKDINCYLTVGNPPGKDFNEMLWDFLRKSGLTEPQVYHSCNMGRDTFSSIINKKNLSITKKTAVQLCFGLKLSYEDSMKLLESAGYTLSDSILFDYVIICYLRSRNYNIHDVNITLYDKGVPSSLLLLQRRRKK